MKTTPAPKVIDAVCGISVGIAVDHEGYTTLTLTESKTFKTAAGATKWLAVRGYNADGTKRSA